MTTTSPVAVRFEAPARPLDLSTAKAGQIRFLVVPPIRYFAVDGTGAPGGPAFSDAFGALYPVAYTVHFALKKRGIAAPVGALEGLFWPDRDESDAARQWPPGNAAAEPADWGLMRWKLMLQVPEAALEQEWAAAIEDVRCKKAPPALARLHVELLDEGPSAQILHIGPYDAEPPTIATLHAAIAAAGLQPRGHHHEIYLSDPGRTAPEKLKTVIRQPVVEVPA